MHVALAKALPRRSRRWSSPQPAPRSLRRPATTSGNSRRCSPRTRASASCEAGGWDATSASVSSFMIRPRGRFFERASSSRHAAAAFSTSSLRIAGEASCPVQLAPRHGWRALPFESPWPTGARAHASGESWTKKRSPPQLAVIQAPKHEPRRPSSPTGRPHARPDHPLTARGQAAASARGLSYAQNWRKATVRRVLALRMKTQGDGLREGGSIRRPVSQARGYVFGVIRCPVGRAPSTSRSAWLG